jgi:putative ABC transport system permease protein
MNLLRKFLTLLHRGKRDTEMSEEMRLHLEQRTRENIAAGMSADEARYAAFRKFGGVEQAKERARERLGFMSLDHLAQDLRYTLRTLSKQRGFTAVAILTLALGIGVNTAMFSVVYGVLLDPYPYAKSGEIWAPQIRDAKTGRGAGGFRISDYLELSKLPGVASAMATHYDNATLSGGTTPEVITGVRVSGTAFEFLGVPPVIGRGFTPADIKPNGEAEPVTVLSFKLWQRLYNGDPQVVGRTLMLNERPHAILGVMPPRFGWYTNDGLWLPMATTNGERGVSPILRLKPGVTHQVVEQQFLALAQRLAAEAPDRFPKNGFTVRLHNYLDVTVSSGEMRSSLHLLFGAVGFLLLIACTNVANLQLARASTRSREIAIRLAIGATRARVVRQLLTESVALALGAGLAGVFLAFGLTQIIVSLMPEFYVPNEARVTMNGWVLAFSVAVSMFTGILFGLAPGLQCTKPDLTNALKAGGHAAGIGDVHSTWTRNALVVAEVALAIVLLVGASLAIRGFVELQRIDRGFRPEHTLILRAPLAPKRYTTIEQRNGFARDLMERVRTLPGVVSVAIGMPPGFEGGSGVTIPGQPKPSEGFALSYVSADYLATHGIALRAGRNLTPQEIARGERVALINETASKLWLNGESPLGRTIDVDALVGGNPNSIAPANATKSVTIVGIIGDTRRDLRRVPQPAVVVPYTLRGLANRSILVRTRGEATSLFNAVRAEVRALDPEQPLLRAVTMEEITDQQTVQPRFNMALFSALAGIGLALAAAGIYSVLSYHVTQRTREIGVRLALGATRRDILRLVIGAGGRLVGIGLLIGVAASAALAKILTTEVFTVPLLDPLALAGAALLLGVAGLLACLIPGRRATRVDPMTALRAE